MKKSANHCGLGPYCFALITPMATRPDVAMSGHGWRWTPIQSFAFLTWLGLRDAGYGTEFMNDVAGRLANRVQLTTDGHRAYLDAVDDAFGGDVDYSQLIKIYGPRSGRGARSLQPASSCRLRSTRISGSPDRKHVSTSYVERQNLTVRMSMRRFTRLTNALSKKAENLAHNLALHYMHYNFCRIHQTLRVNPAMEAGIADHVWELEEWVALIKLVDLPGLAGRLLGWCQYIQWIYHGQRSLLSILRLR